MQKLNAVIIDDELSGRETLTTLLQEYISNIEVIGTADGVEKGQDLILSLEPDLVFLDIEMKDGSGFDLLKAWEKLY